jgi:hypothetical protein
MGWIAAFFIRAGLPARRARQLAIGLLIMLAMVGLLIGKLAYDRRVVANYDARTVAVQARADRAADATAATRRRSDDARLEAEADALEKVTEDATHNAISADPRAQRRAYYDCIRLQQQARAAGHLTPTCR